MSNSKIVSAIKEVTLQLLKEGAPPRSARRDQAPPPPPPPPPPAAPKPVAPTATPAASPPATSAKTKDTSDDPTAPIVANPKKPVEVPGVKKPSIPGTVGSGHGVASAKNPDVMKMQQAILDFADIASSTDVTSLEGNKEGRQTGAQTRAIPMVGTDAGGGVPSYPKKEEGDKFENEGFLSAQQQGTLNEQTKNDKKHLGGSDAFGNFITSNYIPKDSYIGKQYLNVDVAGKDKRESASMPPSNLRGIIDTIKRVGSPNSKGEKVTDGIWQNRTNNSLHVIADLIQAMLNFTKDMNVQVPGYTEKDLQTFKANVPAAYTDVKSQEEFSKRAQTLIPELRKMTEYFRYLNGKVFNNQQLRKYIDQKQSFTKYDNIQIPDEKRARGIPGIQFDWIQDPKSNWISLHELSSLDNFKKFLERVVQVPSSGGAAVLTQNKEVVKRYLDLVSQKLNEAAATSSRK